MINFVTWTSYLSGIQFLFQRTGFGVDNFQGHTQIFINIMLCLFFWPHCTACGILVPQPGILTQAFGSESANSHHWTAREFPICSFLNCQKLFIKSFSLCNGLDCIPRAALVRMDWAVTIFTNLLIYFCHEDTSVLTLEW